MKCNECGVEMAAAYGYNNITKDAKLFRIIVHQCINNKCSKYLNKMEQSVEEEVGIPKEITELIPK